MDEFRVSKKDEKAPHDETFMNYADKRIWRPECTNKRVSWRKKMQYPMVSLWQTLALTILAIAWISNSAFVCWLASKKGYSAGLWFFLGLLFGLVALFSIGFAPDEYNRKLLAEIKTTVKERRGNTMGNDAPIGTNTGDFWYCKVCGDKNMGTATSCKGCGSYK